MKITNKQLNNDFNCLLEVGEEWLFLYDSNECNEAEAFYPSPSSWFEMMFQLS